MNSNNLTFCVAPTRHANLLRLAAVILASTLVPLNGIGDETMSQMESAIERLPQSQNHHPMRLLESMNSMARLPLEDQPYGHMETMQSLHEEAVEATAAMIEGGMVEPLIRLLEDLHWDRVWAWIATGSLQEGVANSEQHLDLASIVALRVAFADHYEGRPQQGLPEWTRHRRTRPLDQWAMLGNRSVEPSARNLRHRLFPGEGLLPIDDSNLRLGPLSDHRTWLAEQLREAIDTDEAIIQRLPLIPRWLEMLADEDSTAMDFLRLVPEHDVP